MTKTTDTSREAVEAFIQGPIKEGVISEGLPRTREDTETDYMTVDLLRALLTERDALQTRAGRTELEQTTNDEARHAHRELIQRLTERVERAEAERDAGLIREKDANTRAMQNLRRAEKAEIASKNYAGFNHVWRRRAERAEALREAATEVVKLLWESMSKQEDIGPHGGYIYMKLRAALAQLDAEPAGVSEPAHREVWEQAKEAAAELAQSMYGFTLDREGNAAGVRAACPEEISEAIRAMPYPGDSQ